MKCKHPLGFMKNVILALVCFLVKLYIVYSPMIPSSRYPPGIMGKKIKNKNFSMHAVCWATLLEEGVPEITALGSHFLKGKY